jgi:hypothetical protein
VKQFDDILSESVIDVNLLKEKCYRGISICSHKSFYSFRCIFLFALVLVLLISVPDPKHFEADPDL